MSAVGVLNRSEMAAPLMILRCRACDDLLSPDRSACTSCGDDDLERVRSSGAGTIVSWTVVDCSPSDEAAGLVPCALAIVALDDGPWIYAWLDGETTPPGPGSRAVFRCTESGERFPLFVTRRA
ncbi:Zn-ribbon domain-containing OB-fold protein [Rhodococcus kronopolitis]|uniref:Zn-ribbon domain-containing OB-fold protein n=1 Tax=Rhodococcus kronopolitis TaxID=1460226 RepID=A0ABV9FW93_9NOCA